MADNIDFIRYLLGFVAEKGMALNYRRMRLSACFDATKLYMLTLTSVIPNAEVSGVAAAEEAAGKRTK